MLHGIACTTSGGTFEFEWQPQNSGLTASLRGVSALNEKVVWVSGSGGKYAWSHDGGTSWQTGSVPDADSLDFRDVEVISESVVYLMSAGPGRLSRIYKTVDAGNSWKLQFVNPFPEGFFNSIAFWDADHGIALSDPVEGRLYLITTNNGGASWERIPPSSLPEIVDGEYGFAASGTNIALLGKSHVWIGTGGARARVIYSHDGGVTWAVAETPIISGEVSAGIFSVAFRDASHGIIVGGDYRNDRDAVAGVARSTDGGRSWELIQAPETVAYRSCVAFVPETSAWIAVGTSGSSVSFDDGLTWTTTDTTGYHTMSFADSNSGWAAGAGGRVARFRRR